MASYVLDTSAIMCFLFREEGAHQVLEILESARHQVDGDKLLVFVPFVTLMEMEYWMLRRISPREVEETLLLVESWPIQVSDSRPEWRHQAALVKARTSLSVADAWIASLAILVRGDLVHKDPEFDQVEGLKSLRLPYSRSTP